MERRLSKGWVVYYEFDHINTVYLERNVDWNVPLPFVEPGDLSLGPFSVCARALRGPIPILARSWCGIRALEPTTGNTFRVEYRLGCASRRQLHP